MQKNNGILCLIIISLAMFLFFCCEDDPIGKCGPYMDISGTAEIIYVQDADPGSYNCPRDPVEIAFVFEPDDSSDYDRYIYSSISDSCFITCGDGKNPNRGWALEEDLTEGSVHECLRSELTWGACPPVIFNFPELDYDKANDSCF